MFWLKNILYKIFGNHHKGDYETFEFEYFKPPSENVYESIQENETIFGETSICSNKQEQDSFYITMNRRPLPPLPPEAETGICSNKQGQDSIYITMNSTRLPTLPPETRHLPQQLNPLNIRDWLDEAESHVDITHSVWI